MTLALLGATSCFAQSVPATGQTQDTATPPKPGEAPAPVAAPGAPKAKEEDDVLMMEAFVTTGTTIKRVDNEAVLPVTLFNVEKISARDSTTSMDLLVSIPQITSIPANETSTNAVASRGGNASASLRAIGAENTLVLFNGRRVPFNPISATPPVSTVNINVLPTVGLQQIEVLRDGASALYGSDAVAGVINYITDNNVKGTTVSVRYGVTEHGGGSDIQGTMNFGKIFAGGKGRWVTTLNAYTRDKIMLSDREVSASADRLSQARAPWNVAGSVYDGRQSTTQWTTFRLGSNAVSGTVYYFYPVNGTPAITTTAMPRDLYANYNKDTVGQPSSTRTSMFTRVEYDLTPNLTAFGEVLTYYSKSTTGRQPITLTSSDARVTLSADNPYNPFGSAFYNATGAGGKIASAPSAITVASKLLVEGGNERVEASDQVYRVLGGVKGKIGDSTWRWESAAMAGGYRITDQSKNSVRESLLKAAAQRTDASAWNPFGYTFKLLNGQVVVDSPYTNPSSVQNSYTQSADRVGHSKLASLDAHVTGEVFNLWAGPLSATFGGEWRYEQKADYKPEYVGMNPTTDASVTQGDNDILVMSPKYNYQASRTIASAFAETNVPLASKSKKLLWVDSFDITGSIRYERYSDFGNATKPKVGVNAKPLSWLLVRASYNEGFRAPDLTAMKQPTSFTVATPPGNRDTVRNNYFTGAGLSSDTQVLNRTYSLPNPSLTPEESKGFSTGIVIEVPKVKGLSLTVDYWEIKQQNLIFSQTRNAANDEALLRAYTQQQLAAGKDILAIDVGSRSSADSAGNYVGDPYTLRAAPTADDIAKFKQTYATLPREQWIAPVGQWLGATTQLVNGTGNAFTNGFDYELDYNFKSTALGSFRFTSTWSEFLNKFTKDSPTDPKNDDVTAMLLPKWKTNTTLQWRKGPWGGTISATYQSDIRTNAQTNATGYASAGSPSYIKVIFNDGQTYYYEEGQDQLQVNLGFSYRFDHSHNPWIRNTTFRIGVNNLFDEKPALVVANDAGTSANLSGYSGGTGSSLWIGRAYSLSITREF